MLYILQELLILKNHVSRNSISSFAINRNGILRFFGISVFGSRLQPRSEGVERSNLGTGHSLQPVHPAGKRTCTFLKRLIKRDKDERHVLERSLHPWSHLLSPRFLRAPSKAVKRLRPGHGPRTCVDTLHLYQ